MARTLNGGVGKGRRLWFLQSLRLRPKPGGSKGRIGAIGGLKERVEMENRLNTRRFWLLTKRVLETEKHYTKKNGRDRVRPRESNRHTATGLRED